MDYTKVPRSLIYQERDIDDFFEDPTSFESAFCDSLLKRPFMKNLENQAETVLDIFNNAYYICTLIHMEEHPRLYINKYRKIASNHYEDPIWVNHIMPSTMALVYSLLFYYQKHFTTIDDNIFIDICNLFRRKANEEVYDDSDFNDLLIKTDICDFSVSNLDKFTNRDIYKVIANKYISPEDIAKGIDYIITETWQLWDNELHAESMFELLTRLQDCPKSDDIEMEYAINEIKDFLKQKSFDFPETVQQEQREKTLLSKQMVLFVHALANWGNFSYTNMKEDLGPIVHQLFGVGLQSAKNKFSEGYSTEDRNTVAAIFSAIAPDFADYIRSFNGRRTSDQENRPT